MVGRNIHKHHYCSTITEHVSVDAGLAMITSSPVVVVAIASHDDDCLLSIIISESLNRCTQPQQQ